MIYMYSLTTTAYTRMVGRFSKKALLLRKYPASRTILREKEGEREEREREREKERERGREEEREGGERKGGWRGRAREEGRER